MRAGQPAERLGTTSFRSVPDMWQHRVGSTPRAEAMLYREHGQWRSMTWTQADVRVRRIANALLAAGLAPGQRCVILAETSVEWVLADIAILNAGGATTTLYPSSTAAECAYVINDCQAVLVFCDPEQIDKLVQIRAQTPTVARVVVLGDAIPADAPEGELAVLSVFEAEGRAFEQAHPDAYDNAREAITPDALATLMYTSGTTGEPKGVMLSHDAWVYEAEAIDALGFLNPADRQYLFLPLAHVFAKALQVSFIRLGIPTVVDASIDDLLPNLEQTKPTCIAVVPRVLEKAHRAILDEARSGGRMRYAVFQWALQIGERASALFQQGRALPPGLKVQHALAKRLVFDPIHQRFGGSLRFFISGGAPLSSELGAFFHACDLLVLEGYGLTESGAATCVNRLDDYRFGSVGRPLPGCEVRIAEDGEILIRSRGVMQGYYQRPDATRAAIDDDGWLHTGDLGAILDGEHVKITGRKKDLIVTAGGKNIAPAHFEGLLAAHCSYVSHVVMHGDRRPFCVALIALDETSLREWALDQEIPFTDYADLVHKDAVMALIQPFVDEVNRQLPSFEQVKHFAMMNEEPSRENQLLTTTLKVKRGEVEARYQDELDGFYLQSAAAI